MNDTRHIPRTRLAARAAQGALLALACAAGLAHAQPAAGTAPPVQPAQQTGQSQPMVAATADPAPGASGRTRAEVIAELQCARASGELDAIMLRSHGLPPDQRRGTHAPCTPADGQRR